MQLIKKIIRAKAFENKWLRFKKSSYQGTRRNTKKAAPLYKQNQFFTIKQTKIEQVMFSKNNNA